MSDTFKPLTMEDFALPEAELSELVTGAQKFLNPAVDPQDDEIALTGEPGEVK